jgi:hypothetical protein
VVQVPALAGLHVVGRRQHGRGLRGRQLAIHQGRNLFTIAVHDDTPPASPAFAGLVTEQGFDLGRDRLARPEDPAAYGSDGTVHGLGNLFVAQAFDLAQVMAWRKSSGRASMAAFTAAAISRAASSDSGVDSEISSFSRREVSSSSSTERSAASVTIGSRLSSSSAFLAVLTAIRYSQV